MGRDKATLRLGGVAMAVRVADAARAAGAEEVTCVGAPVEGVAVVGDDHPGEGPLGAVLTALRWAGARAVLVLGCDLVTPSPAVMGRAVDALFLPMGHDLAVPVTGGAARRAPQRGFTPVVGGEPQWLHGAWWPQRPLGNLEARFAAGERAIQRAVEDLLVFRYDEPDLVALADADTPSDLPSGGR